MTTRRRPRQMRAARGNNSPAPPPVGPTITIAGVSQTYGKAAGGSTLYVLGANFVAGMTALTAGGGTFATVSAVTEISATLTTSGGSAGTSDTWHLHHATRTDSAGQSFGYVAAPVQSAISPSTGPGTIANTGAVFTVSNLGAAGSNIPIGGTVGAGAIHGDTVAITAGNSFTADFDAPGIGADALAVTVDGVAATGSVTFTGNTAPVFASATNIGTAGGNVIIRGANFTNSGGTTTVSASGGIGSLAVTFNSSTQLTVAIPAHAGGTFDLTITNPDAQFVVATGGLVISATSDPGAVFGANLSGWYRADTGFATDKSGSGNSLTLHGSPTTTTSAAFNGQPYYALNGTTQFFERASFAHAGSTGQACFFAAVLRYPSAPGGTTVVVSYNNGDEIQMLATGILRYSGAGLTAPWGVATTATPLQIYGDTTAGTNGNPGTSVVAISNGAAVSAAGNLVGTLPASANFAIGGRQAGSLLAAVEVAEVVVANVVPNGTQLNQLAAYFNLRYALESNPTFSSITLVGTSGGGARIQGTGFISGVTVTAGGGIGALTTTFVSSTVIEVTVPAESAGSYDLTITNPDGGEVIVSGALVVSATDNVMSKLGLKVVGWYRADQVSLSGSNVTGITDLSNRGNTPGTVTAITQTATDANFSNQPTMVFNGTSAFAKVTGFALSATSRQQFFVWAVVRLTSTTASQMICSFNTTGITELRTSNTSTGHAQMIWSAIAANSPSVVAANLTRAVYGSNTGGASGTSQTVGASVSNEAPTTGTGTSPADMAASADLGIGARSGGTNFAGMALAELVITNTIPSAGELTFLESAAQSRYGVP
jgi:hypothetical protein